MIKEKRGLDIYFALEGHIIFLWIGRVVGGLLVDIGPFALRLPHDIEIVSSRVGGFMKFVNHINKIIGLLFTNCNNRP